MREAVLVAVMSVVTILLRFLPFLVLRKETPISLIWAEYSRRRLSECW